MIWNKNLDQITKKDTPRLACLIHRFEFTIHESFRIIPSSNHTIHESFRIKPSSNNKERLTHFIYRFEPTIHNSFGIKPTSNDEERLTHLIHRFKLTIHKSIRTKPSSNHEKRLTHLNPNPQFKHLQFSAQTHELSGQDFQDFDCSNTME